MLVPMLAASRVRIRARVCDFLRGRFTLPIKKQRKRRPRDEVDLANMDPKEVLKNFRFFSSEIDQIIDHFELQPIRTYSHDRATAKTWLCVVLYKLAHPDCTDFFLSFTSRYVKGLCVLWCWFIWILSLAAGRLGGFRGFLMKECRCWTVNFSGLGLFWSKIADSRYEMYSIAISEKTNLMDGCVGKVFSLELFFYD